MTNAMTGRPRQSGAYAPQRHFPVGGPRAASKSTVPRNWPLAIGHSLVIGHWTFIGHWSLVIGHWSLVIRHWSFVIGHWAFIGYWALVIGHFPLVMPDTLSTALGALCLRGQHHFQVSQAVLIGLVLEGLQA